MLLKKSRRGNGEKLLTALKNDGSNGTETFYLLHPMWRWSDGGHRRSTYWLARQNHLSRVLAGNSLIACGLEAIPLGKKKKSYIEIPNVEQSMNCVS